VVANQGNSNNPTQNSQPVTPTQSSGSSSNSNSMMPTLMQTMGSYKDGSYTGSVQDAFYGNIQVRAVISGGKITDVLFLQFPNDIVHHNILIAKQIRC